MSGGDVILPSELHEMIRSNGDLPMLSFEGTKHASQDGVRRPSTWKCPARDLAFLLVLRVSPPWAHEMWVGGSREHGPHASETAGSGRSRRDWWEPLWHMRDLVYAYGWPCVWVLAGQLLKIRSGSSALSRLMRLLNWCISLSKKWNDEIEEVVVWLNWLQLMFA